MCVLFLGGGCISAVNTSDDPLPYKTSVIDDPYLILKRNFFLFANIIPCRPFTSSTHKTQRLGCNCYIIPVFPLWSSQPSPGSVAVPPLWSGRWCGHTSHTEGR